MCSLANCNLFSTSFFQQWDFAGLLADSLASHRHLLIVIQYSQVTLDLL
ncbi:unnamed protein product [Staurois parvus]|uniref:Uncharacterized protein n=1 Tax=Staurois parvus TaxID=386267 RepID=A0ABN9CG33_9NEOB|nr:unnamed protein product [Staurois parvus]